MKWKLDKALTKGADGFWHLRKMVRGKAIKAKLPTRDKGTALKRAIQLCDAALLGHDKTVKEAKARRDSVASVGDILDAYEKGSPLSPKYTNRNINSLTFLIASVRGVEIEQEGRGRVEINRVDCSSSPKAVAKRRKLIGKLPGSVLTAELLADFKEHVLGEVPPVQVWEGRHPDEISTPGKLTPADLNKQKRKVNRYLRGARSLFAKRSPSGGNLMSREAGVGIYAHLKMPDLTGFMAVSQFKVNKKSYRAPSRRMWAKIEAAVPELKEKWPEGYKVFLFARNCGLRLGEIKFLKWEEIEERHDGEFVHVTENHFTDGSKVKEDRDVKLPDGMLEELEDLKTDSRFVIGGDHHFRNWVVEREVSDWMRAHGWNRQQTVHELRKWFGAQLATQTGDLYAVKKILGHKSYQTTLDTYEDLVKYPEYQIPAIGKSVFANPKPPANVLAVNVA